MNQKKIVKTGKFLALILRHKPETIGITLDSKGRVKINDLIKAMNAYRISIDRKTLDAIVETDNKGRFIIDGEYIYAAQGHSISVDVELEEIIPPNVLFHGTAIKNINSINEQGINSRSRRYVHLSKDKETAIKVGSRHGKPVILTINTKAMYENGHKFYLSKNNVWLTNFIPKEYIAEYNYN